MTTRIAVSALTGAVHMGRVNKAGTAFLDGKKDITSDFFRAVLEKANFHGGTFDIRGGGELWTVTVTKENQHG